MALTLLTTKLHVPAPRPNLVARSRLIAQLGVGPPTGHDPGLILVSAPAGFGKTSLISDWIVHNRTPAPRRHFAWLALDEDDNDATRFLTYIVAALQSVVPALGQDILAALQGRQPPPADALLVTLVNDIAALGPDEIVLVLDDYHVIDDPAIDHLVGFLLEHRPVNMRFVLITRADPALPLSRMRARGHLVELRAADLRFSNVEVTSFLIQVMGLSLEPPEIAALAARTEGWIAGLQLAALSLRGRGDASMFIQSFAGNHRYIIDYLADEVLERQPEPLRRFLLQTSILSRLNGELCEAVTGQSDSNGLLATLEHDNLFVEALDDRRVWFRYHQLFADALHSHLLNEHDSGFVTALHRRASVWFAQHRLTAEAIQHALHGHDQDRAADLIEESWSDMDRHRQSGRWLSWVRSLPDDLVRRRGVLCAGYAWALLDQGELEKAEPWLHDSQVWLEQRHRTLVTDRSPQEPPAARPAIDEYRFLPATIASAHAYRALSLGNIPETVRQARSALDQLPREAAARRGIPAALLGIAAWSDGDLEEAVRALKEASAAFQLAGNAVQAITGTYVLATILATLGRLREAEDQCRRSVDLAETVGPSLRWVTADLHAAWSEICLGRHDLEGADDHLRQSERLATTAPLIRWRFRWSLAQANLMRARHDLEAAHQFVDEAERHYVRGPVPDVRPLPALRARLWLEQGRLDAAVRWAAHEGLMPHDPLTYLREYDHITLARLRIAQLEHDPAHSLSRVGEAMLLLERLLAAAEVGKRTRSAMEIRVLRARAHHLTQTLPDALADLEQALEWAEREGGIDLFACEGPPMTGLLEEAARKRIRPSFVAKLLGLMGEPTRPQLVPGPIGRTADLLDPLTERELEALRLIAEGLSNREMADRLFLALPTIKGINRTLFSKLRAGRRSEAVARARVLGLL